VDVGLLCCVATLICEVRKLEQSEALKPNDQFGEWIKLSYTATSSMQIPGTKACTSARDFTSDIASRRFVLGHPSELSINQIHKHHHGSEELNFFLFQ